MISRRGHHTAEWAPRPLTRTGTKQLRVQESKGFNARFTIAMDLGSITILWIFPDLFTTVIHDETSQYEVNIF